jgi:nicotinate phosphoribosyltransferase
VGERLITSRSSPVFDGVYKLAAVEEADGKIIPRIKISENVGKITNPHFKKLYRFFGRESGMAEADYIALWDEVVDDPADLTIRDPDAVWKRKTMTNFRAKEMLVPIFKNGSLVYNRPSLPEIRRYCEEQIATLWPEVLRFSNPHKYIVDLSDTLLQIKNDLLNAGTDYGRVMPQNNDPRGSGRNRFACFRRDRLRHGSA